MKRTMYLVITGMCMLMLSTITLAGDSDLTESELFGVSFFTPRSQSTDAARDLVGWHRYMHLCDKETSYGALAVTAEYAQSFRAKRLAQYFFGTDLLQLSGSFNPNRNRDQFLADYFGLSPSFVSFVKVRPRLQNCIVDIAGYWQRNQWYFECHFPLAWTATTMGLHETIETPTANEPYPAGYMAVDEIPAPYITFPQAMLGTQSFGQVENLKFGKIACGRLCKAGLSDIMLALGYDLVNRGNGHAGFNLRLGIPTGNRPTSEFIFEPIIGNGRHIEFGLGFNSSVVIWEQDGTQELDFWFTMNAIHLFNTCQRRSFDFFCPNGFASRYILLKEFEDSVYTGRTLPAINITTLPCLVSNDIQFDIVFMFAYEYENFNFDIGYNLWLRSAEKICLSIDPFVERRFAFKGIQNVQNADLSTNSTQSTATIQGNFFDDQDVVADPNPPVFIAPGSLDILSAASPLQFTNAIFWNFQYVGCAYKHYEPFIGLGGKFEFEGERPKTVLPNKNSLSQWALWIKGGLAY